MPKGKRLVGPIKVNGFRQIGFGGMLLLDTEYREIILGGVLLLVGFSITLPFWQDVWTEEEIEEAKEQAKEMVPFFNALDNPYPLVSSPDNPYPMLRELGLDLQIRSEIEGQISYIPWSILEEFFASTEDWSQEEFNDFMTGQTVVANGPYPWDVERFFQRLPVID